MAGGLLAGLMNNPGPAGEAPASEAGAASLSGLNGGNFQLDDFLANSTAGLSLEGGAAPPAAPAAGSDGAAATPAATVSATATDPSDAAAAVAPAADGTSAATADGNAAPQAGVPQQMMMPQQMMQMPVPVQYVNADGTPVVAPVATTQGGNPAQQQQQQYYMQQPAMYVDQNGQPIYYQQDPNMQHQMQYVQSFNAQGQPQMTPVMMQPPRYGGGHQGRGGAPPLPGGIDYRQIDAGRRDRNGDYRGGGGRDGPRDDYGGGYGGGGGYSRDYRDDYRERRGGREERYGRGGRGMDNGVNPGRDPLVDEFRSTFGKSRQWGIRDVLGHVVAFCQDQHGSRFIQQRLEVCDDDEKQLVFEEILPVSLPLMTDVFGNYVLQKLFEYGTPDQCEQLGLLLAGQAVQLSMQMYGCRVVQKALEYVNTERLMALVSEFEDPPVLLRCVHDSNGNHVIQKCIEIVSRVSREAQTPEAADFVAGRIQFVIDTFKGRVKELSSHPYGCRVVQRILEHCPNKQKQVILEELRQCCSDLVQDCYGNYVIQFVMQHGWDADRAVLIKEVQQNLLEFSQHKFASNVVEKCLQYASRRDRDEMIWTIINVTFDINNPVDSKGHCVLESMVRDPYANYVVQKVIDVSDERQRSAILRYVRENINQLRRYTYGKHIIVRLEKLTNEKF